MPPMQYVSKSANTIAKTCLTTLVQHLMDIEVSQILSASRYERSDSRRAYRNGYRKTVWNTSIGNIELQIPKLRRGTYYPDRLLNDQFVEQQLVELIHQCIVHGVAFHRISESIRQLSLVELSTYEIHSICDALHLITDTEKPNHQRSTQILRLSANDGLSNEQINEEQQFWRDFSRRMAHTRIGVEEESSILSGVNPYARIGGETPAIIRPDFTQLYTRKILYVA